MEKGTVIAFLIIGGIAAIFPIIAFVCLMIYIFSDKTCFKLTKDKKIVLVLCTIISLCFLIKGLDNIHELEKD